ncbi:hypothetical protein [Stenotrophomonas sp.]|uniref:hypothetical protein n=1 Tax=Stenotrophomonas sp. TaxID=69392 RepID=UPI0028A87542|nr:hypothetical protein [Stenotrophomonas sp.]
MTDRRDELTAAMKAAGCSDPRSWVNSELGEDLPQFARFLMLRDVHTLADDVDSALSEALFDRPDLEQTLATLRGAVDPQALHALLRAYGKALGNSFVMAVDEGPAMREDGMPGWLLMETDANDEPTGRLVQGLHEDYLDFDDRYTP